MKTIQIIAGLLFVVLCFGIVGKFDSEDEMRIEQAMAERSVISLDCIEVQTAIAPQRPQLSRLAAFSSSPQPDTTRRLECLVAKESFNARH
jgi:hypothetical protein